MGRKKIYDDKCQPWLWLGITEGSYRSRISRGIPLDNGRYSGKKYENSPEKLEQIKEKYKNGVTLEILNEWMDSLTTGGNK